MSYRLKVKEPLAEGIRRVALEQIEIAEGELRGNGDANVAVHNARRALKRLRALLRLVRPGLNEADYRREARRFADIGRLLAGERDRHVMRQTLKKLAAEKPELAKGLLPAFETLLDAGSTSQGNPEDVRGMAAGRLVAARRVFSAPTMGHLEGEHVFAGLAKVYRKARRLNRHCHEQKAATDEEFHALRKCVQQHWRHMQLLSRAWPEALSARASEAKALSQLLGEDHDLHVLMAYAEAHADGLPPDGLTQLRSAVQQAQARLRDRGRLHGARLFSERADDLVERLRTYWATAQGLTDLEKSDAPDAPVPPVRATRVVRASRTVRAKVAKPGSNRPAAKRAP